MIRKLLVLAAAAVAFALIAGVNRASADTIVFPTVQPDLRAQIDTRSVTVYNAPHWLYPTKTSGAFYVRLNLYYSLYDLVTDKQYGDGTFLSIYAFTNKWFLVPGLAPGQSYTLPSVYSPYTGWTDYARVRVDPLGWVAERDETNNDAYLLRQ